MPLPFVVKLIIAFAFVRSGILDPVFDFLFGVPDEEEGREDPGRSVTTTKRGTLEHIPVVYGTRRVGGKLNFKGVAGDDNEYLYYEFILSEGECESLVDIFLDEESYTLDKYNGLVQFTFYPGTDSHAADPDLLANFADYVEDDRCLGLCKVVIRLQFDEKNLSREPKFEFLINGKKILDVRDDSVAFSNNPALCVYDYLINSRYGLGYKISESNLVKQDFINAANLCETQIELYSGAGVNTDYYQMHAVIDTGESVRKNVIEMINSFHAHLVPDGNNYRFFVESDDSAVLTLNHDNIIDSSVSIATSDVKDRFNEITIDFANESKEYLSDQIIIQNNTLLTEDNDISSSKRIKNYHDTNQYRQTHFANIVLKKSRQGIAVGLTCSEEGFKVLPGAIIELTYGQTGFVDKKFRVLRTKELNSGNVALNLIEHESTVYDRTVPVEAPTAPDTYLPNPFFVAQVTGLSAASGEEHLVANSSGDVSARILLSWSVINDIFVSHYEIRHRVHLESEWIYDTPTIGKDSNSQYISDVEDGVDYELQVRAVNGRGVAGEWSASFLHEVVGQGSPPPDVSTFIIFVQTDGTREATWLLENPPLDIAGYKIRFTTVTSETWADMKPLHEGLLTHSPFEFNLLTEGEYKFAIKAFDRGGRESNNALYVITDLPRQRIGTLIRSDNPRGQGWPGTLTDCFIDAGDNSLVASSTTEWDDLTDGWDDYDGDWYFDTATSFIYQYEDIDLGVELTYSLSVQVDTELSPTITIEEQHSSDGTTWSSWAAIVGLIEARYQRVRVTVENLSNPPKITNMNIDFGADAVIDNFRLLNTSGITAEGSGGIRLPITSEFKQITDVNIAMQSVGSGATWEIIDLDETNGPHVKMYNGAGTLIYPTITASVHGV